MSGIEMVVERMTDHDYTGIAQGVVQSLLVQLAEIDVSQYREGTLEVLVNNATIPTGCTLSVVVYALARTSDDAGKQYFASSAVASASISAGSNPTLVLAALAANFGGTIAIAISAAVAQGSTTGTFKSKFETRISLKN